MCECVNVLMCECVNVWMRECVNAMLVLNCEFTWAKEKMQKKKLYKREAFVVFTTHFSEKAIHDQVL